MFLSFIVEGSLSSSRIRKKVEARELKSNECLGINSDQQHYAVKAGEFLIHWLFVSPVSAFLLWVH